jgi:xanthine dehydrogenase accessory factor
MLLSDSKKMNKWISDLPAPGESSVLVTVISVRGSAPREIGAKMVVTSRETIGTIGGGQLEYQCTLIACEQLNTGRANNLNMFIRRYALGANCGQCCGGVVEVMFEVLCASGADWLAALKKLHDERIAVVIATSTKYADAKYLVTDRNWSAYGRVGKCPDTILAAARLMLADSRHAQLTEDYLLELVKPTSFNIAVFGAGHVGAATVDVLRRLDCNIRWIDSRKHIFPAALPDNVLAIESADPSREVLAMPPGSLFLIMTHSHSLDQEICARVLRREDFAYCGLIGSLSKRRRFERLLKKQGVTDSMLNRLVCPIGVKGVSGKKPVEIAIAVAAEVLQVRDASPGKMTMTDAKESNVQAI